MKLLAGVLFLLLVFASQVEASLPETAPQTSVAESRSLYADVYLHAEADRLVYGNSKLSLEMKGGHWLALRSAGVPGNLLAPGAASPAVDFQIDDTWMIARHGATFLRHEVSIDRMREGVSLRLIYAVRPAGHEEFQLTSTYTLFPSEKRLMRAAELVRRSGAKTLAVTRRFQGFLFELPGVSVGEAGECVIDVPGPFFPNTFVAPGTPYAALRGRAIRFHSAPDAGFGILAVGNRRLNMTLATWMETGGEVAYRPALKSEGERLTFTLTNERAYRLSENLAVSSDAQHVEIVEGPLAEALGRYRRMVTRTMPLATAPAWTRGMVILEAYPQYYPGGFKGLAARLPFYREVGFNVLYLMPHWAGGYSPLDLYQVDPALGTREDLRALVARAHALGMKVLFDMVIHGFNVKSPVVTRRPELFVRDETGRAALHPTWKSVTTDWASPEYQQYMVELVLHDLRTYNIDGYRVDAATYKGPGWDPRSPRPAYRSGSAAPELMKRMLTAMREHKPEAVLLSEVFGPVFYSVSNLGHDNQTEAPQLLLEKMEAGEYTAAHYREHLANVYDALPAGANRVFYTRNHDTSWFYHFNGYTPRFMAMEAIHAFFGIPEVFGGDPKHGPDPDATVYQYYRRLFAARLKYPELIEGEIALREVDSDNPQVFTGLRRWRGRTTLVAVSMSGKEERARLTLAARGRKKGLTLLDPQTGEMVRVNQDGPGIDLKLKPFQALVGRL